MTDLWNNTVRPWRANGKSFATVAGHEGPTWSPAFLLDGNSVLTAANDKTEGLWQVSPTAHAIVDHAKYVLPRFVQPDQRRRLHVATAASSKCENLRQLPHQMASAAIPMD